MEQTLTMLEKTETGIVTTLLGMVTVFVVLILLIFFVTLLKNLSKKKNEQVDQPIEPSTPVLHEVSTKETQNEDEMQIIAVIGAALNAYLGDERASALRVHSIRRIASADNSWSLIGRNETITNRQNLYRD